MGTKRTKVAPTRLGSAWFAFRIACARLRRTATELIHPVPRLRTEPSWVDAEVLSQVRSPLWTSLSPAEARLETGKVQNLRVAATRFDGLVLEPGSVFSFWRQLGPTRRGKGFVPGRQLQEGCLIASKGGGICQLSNGLYEAAVAAGLEILERHRHTQVIRGSAAERGQDATVAWNHIDLRFRSAQRIQLRVRLTLDELSVYFLSRDPVQSSHVVRQGDDEMAEVGLPVHVGSCDTCGETGCFRHLGSSVVSGRTAFLLDEVWPEFDEWVRKRRKSDDRLFAPIDGRRWKRPQYDWPDITASAWLETVRFGRRMRNVSEQGAVRQGILLDRARALVDRFASGLNPDETNLVIQLPLLPFLWLGGHLGGRRFTVLMTRLPMDSLQARLDEAFARFPERGLLADFRAPARILQAEREALEHAERIVTPHPMVADEFGPKSELIPWQTAPSSIWRPGPAIGFPGPATARKGAYEVREAARALGMEVVLGGRNLEGDDFWEDIPVRRADVLDGVFAVVQPSLLEDRPRSLLKAQASGCPVICTEACGLNSSSGSHYLAYGDGATLIEVLRRVQQTACPAAPLRS